MAAYGAASSLKSTIHTILQSSRISLVHASPQVLHSACEAVARLMDVLLNLEDTGYSKIRTKVNALDERIKDAIWEFEDLLESHVYEQILPQLESSSSGGERDGLSLSVDLQSLQQSVDCFVERLTEMELEYDIEVVNMPEEEGEPIASRIDFGGISSNMVGLYYFFEETRNYLLEEDKGNCLSVIGMAGVGKTTVAKKVFDDPLIQRHFELRAWVKVGRKCESNEALRCVLAQVDPSTRHQMLAQGVNEDDQKLVGLLKERLKGKKCLIVLDDVWKWDTRLMDNLPQENVRIMLTSRQLISECPCKRVYLLNQKESEKLLGDKVFGEKGFPPDLEELGKRIAYKCEGLPLMIVTVADLLSKEDKTPIFWTEVAEKIHNSVFVNAYDQISEVFFPSYEYLHQCLKMFFLYLGAYPPYSDMHGNELFHQIHAEGFLESYGVRNSIGHINKCLEVLSHCYHLVINDQCNSHSWFSRNMLRVHSCWQQLCKKETSKIKFLHVLESCDDITKDQRRLCAHSNTLFAFKQVYDAIKSDCASTVRSLLCYGPYHEYPLPIHAMDFKLLRVLNAVEVRFYHIPLELMKLVCLKFLALTCNKELPASISNLIQLQSLIIQHHMNIKKSGAFSYMPVEVWGMQELEHIEVTGRDLPTPNCDATLNKLSCLCGVSAQSCTREILKRIPNLKSLEIVMELKPYDNDDDIDPLSGLDYISVELHKLRSLCYCVPNPEMKYECMVPLSMFGSSLRILTLSGLGCSWKYMNDIGSLLPNLKELSLQHYAFQGPEWEIESGCFLKLKTLIIEDSDLVRWIAQHGSLPMLGLLSIRHCYKLQQLDWTRDPSVVIKPAIELVECNPLAVASAKQLKPESLFRVYCHSTFLR